MLDFYGARLPSVVYTTADCNLDSVCRTNIDIDDERPAEAQAALVRYKIQFPASTGPPAVVPQRASCPRPLLQHVVLQMVVAHYFADHSLPVLRTACERSPWTDSGGSSVRSTPHRPGSHTNASRQEQNWLWRFTGVVPFPAPDCGQRCWSQRECWSGRTTPRRNETALPPVANPGEHVTPSSAPVTRQGGGGDQQLPRLSAGSGWVSVTRRTNRRQLRGL